MSYSAGLKFSTSTLKSCEYSGGLLWSITSIRRYRWKKKINKLFGREIGPHTFTYIFGAAVIASLLPDEIGLSFLSDLPDFKLAPFAIISFILHSAGIFVLLYAESQLF